MNRRNFILSGLGLFASLGTVEAKKYRRKSNIAQPTRQIERFQEYKPVQHPGIKPPKSCEKPKDLSTAEIRQWLDKNYPQTITYTTSPKNWVWTHLVNDHGWKWNQIKTLSWLEAWQLHDASHKKIVKTFVVMQDTNFGT